MGAQPMVEGSNRIFMGRTGSYSLRAALKRDTASLHDTLDGALADWALADGAMASPRDYARFLAVQYRARKPIEDWVAHHLDPDDAPPPQAPLIRADLSALGVGIPPRSAQAEFAMPDGADPIGLKWALAGSSLGNRAMLAQRRKNGLEGPEAFLSDSAMPTYFKRLRPELEREVDSARGEAAVAAAKAVFARFLAALEPLEQAA